MPAEEAFGFVADARNEPEWLPGAAEVRLNVTEYERPARVTIHGEAKGTTFDDSITFTQTADGVELLAVMRTQPRGLFKVVAPMWAKSSTSSSRPTGTD